MREMPPPSGKTPMPPHRRTRFGWIPDRPDPRDHEYEVKLGALPTRVDLRPHCPSVYHQGRLQSCTGNAIAAAIQYDRTRNNRLPDFVPSRLFIYYNGRVLQGTTHADHGSRIRDGIKSVARLGVCPEKPHWPYEEKRFAYKPPHRAFLAASRHRALRYHRLGHNLRELRDCLAAGTPFVFGFTVHDDFPGPALARTGVMKMPARDARKLGGHAALAVGYDDPTASFIIRNSWGAIWGQAGHFTMPYAMLEDPALTQDFWTLQTTTG